MKITGQMHFAKALQQLRKQGVKPGDMTPDELYSLAEASRRCADPFREMNADAAGFPVRVCEGVWFWKLTIGASIWLDEVGEMLGGGSDPRYRLAMIYALVHSRDPGAFAGLYTERKIMRAVRATMRTIHATPEEVDMALDVALGIRPASGSGGSDVSASAADWASLCMRLETQTGIPAYEWIWERSGAYAVRAYHDLNEFARAHSQGGGGVQMRDELDEAMTRLRIAVASIEKRMKALKSSAREKPSDSTENHERGDGGGGVNNEINPPPLGRFATGNHGADGKADNEVIINHGNIVSQSDVGVKS